VSGSTARRSSARISDPQRRDWLLLLNAFAVVLLTLLTLLGAAGESLGMDRHLKSNTVKGTVNLPPFAIRSHNFQFVMEP
jgi:hypothetical protein